jgi:hypothetical protein
LDRAEHHLNWKFSSILSPGVKLLTGSHRPGMRVDEIIATQVRVLVLETLREQNVDRFADQFLGFVAKHRFRLSVDAEERAFLIDQDGGVWCGFKQTAKEGFILAQSLLRRFPFYDLAAQFGDKFLELSFLN